MPTFFISGHRDITEEEFNDHYVDYIKRIVGSVTFDDWCVNFVVGDYHGVDTMAQAYLHQLVKDGDLPFECVEVYHMFDSPRNNVGGFTTIGGFTSDEARDSAMTHASDIDIAWVRPGKEGSGTHQNIMRRQKVFQNVG